MSEGYVRSIYVSQSMYVFLVSLKQFNLHTPPARYHVKRHNRVANLSPEIKKKNKKHLKIKLCAKY